MEVPIDPTPVPIKIYKKVLVLTFKSKPTGVLRLGKNIKVPEYDYIFPNIIIDTGNGTLFQMSAYNDEVPNLVGPNVTIYSDRTDSLTFINYAGNDMVSAFVSGNNSKLGKFSAGYGLLSSLTSLTVNSNTDIFGNNLATATKLTKLVYPNRSLDVDEVEELARRILASGGSKRKGTLDLTGNKILLDGKKPQLSQLIKSGWKVLGKFKV